MLARLRSVARLSISRLIRSADPKTDTFLCQISAPAGDVMFITAHNLVPYLIERGTITTSQVVHDNCCVENSSSRNRCFRVRFDGSPGCFVKQPPLQETGLHEFVSIEAECLRLFQSTEFQSSLGQHVPKLLSYDSARRILSIELLEDFVSLRSYGQQQPTSRPLLARLVGEMLAKFHQPEVLAALDQLPPSARHRVPGVLRDSQNLAHSRDPAGIGAKVSQYPEYLELLQRCTDLWQRDGLMHGDVRWDNVLVRHSSDGLGMCLIDWELAGGGDTAWDLAGLMQAYMIEWITEQITLDELRECANNCWNSYRAQRSLGAEPEFLMKTVRYAGCRLVQSALEHHPTGIPLGTIGSQMLQLSWNLLRDPESVVDELLQLK